MRAGQILQPIASTAWAWNHLIAACAGCYENSNWFASSECLAVPHSPGRARLFYPYPTRRRSRRQ